MRILISLVTAAVVALAAITGGAAGAEEAVGQAAPCRPVAGDTVWDWPLATATAAPSSWNLSRVPAPPNVLRPFEPPVHRWDAGHRGVDLAGVVGAPVVAAGAGTVLFAGRVVDQGVVVVGHGDLRTSYEPVDATVAVGTRVGAGERIGTLDAGHCAVTACLHWGLLSGHAHATVYYDPLLLLGCGGVRLEPTTVDSTDSTDSTDGTGSAGGTDSTDGIGGAGGTKSPDGAAGIGGMGGTGGTDGRGGVGGAG